VRIFGLEVRRIAKALNPVPALQAGWRIISEPWTGAWQRNQEEKRGTLLCYPTLYACLNRISSDIGKLPFLLKSIDANGIWRPLEDPAYSPVLRKPNHYQTAQQFRESWALSKLQHGNTYVLKQRDARGIVVKMYVLDPCRVMPMVSESGDVFYQINYSQAENLLPADYPTGQLTLPASEIIHDRLNCFHHHLIGVPPLCAAYWPVVKNLRILRSSAEFFGNGARPGGILTVPQGLKDEEAEKLRNFWNTNFTGENSGKVAVIGSDVKYLQLGQSSADSQLVEQMRYSDEQVCQPFGIPPFKIGIGTIPAGLGVDAINLLYYNDALQGHIEAMENLLDEALSIPSHLGIWLDLDPLLRMDAGKQAELLDKLVGAGVSTVNEARNRVGYGPLEGGDTVYMQQQDFPLDQVRLNRIPTADDSEPEPEPPLEETARQVSALLERMLPDAPSDFAMSDLDALRVIANQ
jgi:HK97 family phage portal protein